MLTLGYQISKISNQRFWFAEVENLSPEFIKLSELKPKVKDLILSHLFFFIIYRFGNNIPDTIMEEEQLVTSSSTDTSSSDSLKMNSQNRVNSILSSREESPNRPDSSKPFHTSVPNLRTQQKGLLPKNRVTRSSSHDEVKLRKNLGSTDLFSRAIFKRNSVATPDIPRHGSVENVLNPRKGRRKSKTSTIENRIHNLEVGK